MDAPIQWYEGCLKGFVGTYPELAIFRRFGAVNLRNLMFTQAGITDLEQRHE